MYSWALDAQLLGLAIDALASSPLRINRVIQRAGTIHEDTSAASRFIIDVLLTSLAFLELLMFTGLAGGVREEKWAAITQRPIAVGVEKGEGGKHA